jgi:hypothetical protein
MLYIYTVWRRSKHHTTSTITIFPDNGLKTGNICEKTGKTAKTGHINRAPAHAGQGLRSSDAPSIKINNRELSGNLGFGCSDNLGFESAVVKLDFQLGGSLNVFSSIPANGADYEFKTP